MRSKNIRLRKKEKFIDLITKLNLKTSTIFMIMEKVSSFWRKEVLRLIYCHNFDDLTKSKLNR